MIVRRASIISLTILSLALSCAPSNFYACPHLQNDERINLNTASVEELMRLPGIGPTIAARIVEHREKHGPFKRPQDVIIVRGMHAKLYRSIAHLIRT